MRLTIPFVLLMLFFSSSCMTWPQAGELAIRGINTATHVTSADQVVADPSTAAVVKLAAEVVQREQARSQSTGEPFSPATTVIGFIVSLGIALFARYEAKIAHKRIDSAKREKGSASQ